ncbi:MAG: type II CAAX endopeptidase family protein [Terracidiphilus sp.]
MLEDTVVVPEASLAEAPAAPAPDGRRMRWFELSLVIFVAFGQYFIASIYMLNGANDPRQGETPFRLFSILQEATCLLLLCYVLSRRKLRFSDLGLRWSIRDLWTGLGVIVVSYAAYYAGYYLIQVIALTVSPKSVARQTFHWGSFGYYAIPLLLLNPFFEELIVRAYLMTEIRELTGSPILAVVLSVAVQTSYHLYYGWKGALSLAFQFLVFSLYYAKTRRITPVILAHEVFDLAVLFN